MPSNRYGTDIRRLSVALQIELLVVITFAAIYKEFCRYGQLKFTRHLGHLFLQHFFSFLQLEQIADSGLLSLLSLVAKTIYT